LKVDQFFTDLQAAVKSTPELVKSINASYLFQITVNNKVAGNILILTPIK